MKRTIIEFSVYGSELLAALGYLRGNKFSEPSATIKGKVRINVRTGTETGKAASENESHEEYSESPNEFITPAGGFDDARRFSTDVGVALHDPNRFGLNASQLPYKTTAVYADMAATALNNYSRKYKLAKAEGRNIPSLMPTFTNDIGKVVVPLAETILAIPNEVARRDFLGAFFGYLAARYYGYQLDADALPDVFEIWRRAIINVNDDSDMTIAVRKIMEMAVTSLSVPLTERMRTYNS